MDSRFPPVEIDPITNAVGKLIASIPVEDLEDKQLMQAFLTWFVSLDIGEEEMCSAIVTLVGLFVGMMAESPAHLKKGLAIYTRMMRHAADLSQDAMRTAPR
jgi:hypothetical protein